MTDYTFVARVCEIAEGTGKAFLVGNRMIAVFNTGTEYYAIDDVCPHMGASLASGRVENNVVTCPWHAWRFSICDGTWCDNPKISIDNFPTRVINDEIQVSIPEPEPEDSGAERE